MRTVKQQLWRAIVLIAVASILSTCAVNPVTGKKQIMFVSESEEKAMGLQSNPEIIGEFGEYPDANLQAFINEKGKAMAAISHRPNLDYKFNILDTDVVNAFAVPGGYVYFTRGIMAHFNNEAEFAGVLGHEIGHVTARHSAQQQTQEMLAQGGLLVGILAIPELAQMADLASQGLQLLFLKFSREHESQSDELGVQYSTKVGYDAREMATFFKTIDRLSGGNNGGIPNFLSTHPNPLDRYKRVGELAVDAQKTLTNTSDLKVNRDGYLRMIDGILYGADPRQGYVENNVFYHPELKFSFAVPTDWQVQNSPAKVQMAPKDGKAVLNFSLAAEKTLTEAANAAVAADSLIVIENQNIKINGLSAIAIVANRKNGSDPKQMIRGALTIVEYNGLIYKFFGLSLATDFNTYSTAFLNSMRSFKILTDLSKINVTPERIKIETVTKDATFAEVLRSFGVAEKRMEEHGIVNGMLLTDNVAAGTLIKIIRKDSTK
jgi:predicted Zn-dependent protease